MKTGTFAVIILMALGLTSCEKKEIYTVRDETAEQVNWFCGEFDVERWMECSDADSLNKYYKADIRIQHLDCDAVHYGQVNCYLYVGPDIQTPLPYNRHYENRVGQKWTRTIDYEYYEGGITIYVTDNDFAGDVPGPMTFRITLAW